MSSEKYFNCNFCNKQFECTYSKTQSTGYVSDIRQRNGKYYVYCHYAAKYDGNRYLIINPLRNINQLSELCNTCVDFS